MPSRVQQQELPSTPTFATQSSKVPENLYSTIMRTKESVGTIQPIKLKKSFEELPKVTVKQSPHVTSTNEGPKGHSLVELGNEISTECSQILSRPVTRFDIFMLFLEIMKLHIDNMFQEKLIRREERVEWRFFMEKVSQNYKEQARWILLTTVGAGMLSVLSGVMPIINAVGGDWVFGKLSSVVSSLKNIDKDDFFESAQKLTQAFSQMYEGVGRIHNTTAESRRVKDQFFADSAKLSVDEATRAAEENLQTWRQFESTMAEWLRMMYEDSRSLNY